MSAKLIHCHPSDNELGKIYAPDLSLQASPNAMATALASIKVADDASRLDWLRAAKSPTMPAIALRLNPEILTWVRCWRISAMLFLKMPLLPMELVILPSGQ